MKLSRESEKKARAFVHKHARPLERHLLSYYFNEGSAEDVFSELAKYRNPDGGFGHALEPDLRTPGSSAIATTIGLQILRELSTASDHPLVRGAIHYLLDSHDEKLKLWPIIPSAAREAPHAPWWEYDEGLPKRFGGFLANPRAEIVGYLLDYADLVPKNLPERLLKAVVSHLEALPDDMEMHDLLCYVRLAETRAMLEDARTKVTQKLRKAIDRVVARKPSDWRKYGPKPLFVVSSPDSPFAPMLAREIDLNLDYEIEHQREDGSWAPNWSWGGTFPEAWKDAEREWKGVLTVMTLRTLRNFGRIEGS